MIGSALAECLPILGAALTWATDSLDKNLGEFVATIPPDAANKNRLREVERCVRILCHTFFGHARG